MSYRLELSPHARRSLSKIPHKDFRKLDFTISNLEDNPRPHGVKKLKGLIHRIRAGDWRVIYLISDEEKLVSILDVIRRSESTYKGL